MQKLTSIISAIALLSVGVLLLYRYLDRSKKDPLAYQFCSPTGRRIAILFNVGLIIIIMLLAWWALHNIKEKSKGDVLNSINTVLSTTAETLNAWVREQQRQLNLIADDTKVIKLVTSQLKKKENREDMISTPELNELRKIIREIQQRTGHKGFFIISPDGTNIASMRDENMGQKNIILLHKPELMRRALAGETVFVPPIPSDVPLKGVLNIAGKDLPPSLFFIAPVYSLDGTVIAVITERFDPYDEFSRLNQLGRIGNTGETYAFDRQGKLLSESRFQTQLFSIGMIKPGDGSILSIDVRDPGYKLANESPGTKGANLNRPLTRMAVSATNGESGYDVNGYRDYRGEDVIGAWTWLESLGFGLATEMDLDEALESYRFSRNTLLALLGVSMLISMTLTAMTMWVGRRANRALLKARDELENKVDERTRELHGTSERLREREKTLQLALKGGALGLWDFDPNTGRVEIDSRFQEIYGLPDASNSLQLSDLIRYVHPEERRQTISAARQGYWKNGGDITLEYQLNTPKGEVRCALLTGMGIDRQADGNYDRVVGTIQDITDRKQAEQRLAAKERQFRALIESAPIPMIISDAWGDIVIANHPAEDLLGYSIEELQGQKVEILVPESIRINHRMFRKGYMQSPFPREMGFGEDRELTIRTKSGHEIPVDISLSPINTDEGMLIAAAIHDLSSRKKMEYELRLAKVNAEDANRAKSVFLANMSHEIRTPMNAIIGLSHLALKTNLDNKQRNYIDKVQRSAESLLGIINDILDFSKIEAGKLDMEQIDFRLENIFDNLANLVGLKAEEKGVELLFDLPSDLPTALIGDPLRLGQVLINLGNNAVKFTDQGEILVCARVLEQDDSTVMIHFFVRDSGIGMTKDQQQNLFQSFSQADSSTTRKFGGTGLGLAICKQLIGMMGGEIWVESEVGSGSTFHFTVQLGRQQGEYTPHHSDTELGALRVLVADDNTTSREILCAMLTSMGLRADQADKGQVALSMLEKARNVDPYQLVLMDWKMPGMDGVETSRAIQSEHLLEHVPTVVMVTAYGREEASHAAEGVNISGILTKPVTSSALFEVIMSAMGRQMIGESRANSRQDEVAADISKLCGAKVLLVEDNEINQELALELLIGNGIAVEIANNGIEALELLEMETFDGVLMDCQMPLMDGYEATRHLRMQEQFKTLPILAMTANAMAGDREKVLDAGMNDHIAKPINVNEMFHIMAQWITPADPDTDSPVPDDGEAVPELEVPQLPGIDTASGLATSQENRKLYRKLLNKFRDSESNFTERFLQAKESEDHEAAERCAHTLKGVAGNIGAKAVYKAAETLEFACKEKAPDQKLDQLLDKVAYELIRVLEGLGALDDVAGKQGIDQMEIGDPETIKSLLNKIRTLVEEDDTSATDLVGELEELPGLGTHAPRFKRLSNAIGEYDFDLALEEIEKLEQVFTKQ